MRKHSLFFMAVLWSMSNAMEQKNGDQRHIPHYTLAQLRNGTQAVQRQQQLLQPQQQNYALNPAHRAIFGLQEGYTLRNLLERYDSVRWCYAMPNEAYKISEAFEALYPYARQEDDQQNYESSIERSDLHQQSIDRNEEYVQQLPEISYNGHDNQLMNIQIPRIENNNNLEVSTSPESEINFSLALDPSMLQASNIPGPSPDWRYPNRMITNENFFEEMAAQRNSVEQMYRQIAELCLGVKLDRWFLEYNTNQNRAVTRVETSPSTRVNHTTVLTNTLTYVWVMYCYVGVDPEGNIMLRKRVNTKRQKINTRHVFHGDEADDSEEREN